MKFMLDVFDFSNLPDTLVGIWDYAMQVFGELIGHIDGALESMLTVIGQINTVDLSHDSIIRQFAGNIRYIIGDGLFVPMMTLISLSYGIALWNLVLRLIKAIKEAWSNRKKIRIGT